MSRNGDPGTATHDFPILAARTTMRLGRHVRGYPPVLCLAFLAVMAGACNGAQREAESAQSPSKADGTTSTVEPLNVPDDFWKDKVSPLSG